MKMDAWIGEQGFAEPWTVTFRQERARAFPHPFPMPSAVNQ
jgi:hypothetical protein